MPDVQIQTQCSRCLGPRYAGHTAAPSGVCVKCYRARAAEKRQLDARRRCEICLGQIHRNTVGNRCRRCWNTRSARLRLVRQATSEWKSAERARRATLKAEAARLQREARIKNRAACLMCEVPVGRKLKTGLCRSCWKKRGLSKQIEKAARRLEKQKQRELSSGAKRILGKVMACKTCLGPTTGRECRKCISARAILRQLKRQDEQAERRQQQQAIKLTKPNRRSILSLDATFGDSTQTLLDRIADE